MRMDPEKGTFGGLSTSFQAELEPQYADLLLFACCLISGLMDSTIYSAYNTFVSMQTGNTIFVGLGASSQNLRPYGWARSLTSIGSFILGSFLFAQLHRFLGARRRGSLMLSFTLQACLILLTAGLVQGGAISSTLDGKLSTKVPPWDQEVPIVLLSLQSAGQIVASRALGFNEIPTVVITSLLCDLMSDPKLFLLRNEKRDRRVIAFVLTLVGAIVGGWVTKATRAITPILWLSAGIKALLVLAWGFWKAK
ncbi:uncharacterized protein MYU51_020813 [Penicillium brevicompactum]|uniref:uncharacterized protein n=1 Tax=Penicillium brevicompactum TaxID=5074 RepID=UPI0025418E92|nr:uncharacterized protein N7506_008391 [Penicillium brevicompactum]KAJ5325289.1 hypothetical protein N7506_008391 [Penicillium brevicompactum]